MFNFDVFSRRSHKNEAMQKKTKSLTDEFRTRFFLLITDHQWGVSMGDVLTETFKKMTMNLGKNIPAPQKGYYTDYPNGLLQFLWNCDDSHFFDALEYMFQTQSGLNLIEQNHFIDQINKFFELDELPYKVTYGKVERTDDVINDLGIGTTFNVDYTYPKVIRKDSEIINQTALTPVLSLLRGKEFSAANKEFMAGLEDYRHGKYRDAVTKCCSCFESVMKIVCKKRKIELTGKETAGPLISKIIEDTKLPTFFDPPLMVIGTIRNKLGIAHGSGEEEKQVSENMALYTINATAAAILFVTGE